MHKNCNLTERMLSGIPAFTLIPRLFRSEKPACRFIDQGKGNQMHLLLV
jgi:hypothetical protein